MLRSMIIGLALATAATPAAAVTVLTFDFTAAAGTTNSASVSRTVSSKTLTATALHFSVAPDALTNLSQTVSNAQIQQTAPGIGVNGGGSAPQLDTNTASAREGILFTSSVPNFSLRSFKISSVDADDTIQVYGVNADNSFTSLGFSGVIRTSLGGASVVNTAANAGTSVVTLTDPTAYFTRLFFTTRVGGDVTFMGTKGQGYIVNNVTGAVPEPATWLMMIVGFGLVGATARRRQTVVSA